jgi:DNA-binding transcriptional ArsR family regulator
VDVYEALADPVRRELLAEVATRPMRVVDLAARQPISRPAVSKHLRLLTEAGLLEVAAKGRERHYTLRAEPLGEVREFVNDLQVTPRVTTQMLDALDTEVHRTSRERHRAGSTTSHASTATEVEPIEETA